MSTIPNGRIPLKIGVSGVRGIIGQGLSPSLAADFAAAFGGYSGRGAILVGRDTRPSGPMIENAVAAGLLGAGCHVILAGIIPTPTLQIAVDSYEASGGIEITASHNPSEWNALKFIGSDALFLNEEKVNALLDIYNQPSDDFVPESEYKGIARAEKLFDLHAERILANVDVNLIRKAKFRVAADCCNGAGAPFTRDFLYKLGCAEVFTIHDAPSGVFERPPEPVAENLGDLCRCVRENCCNIGFAQDPDGDRISIVDENGHAIGTQDSILAAGDHLLSRAGKGAVVTANIQTTGALAEIVKRYAGKMEYSRVGEINVTCKMKENDSLFGVEGGSGGFLWPAVHPCRDSFSAMALTLEYLASKGKSFSDCMKAFPHYDFASVKIPMSAQEGVNALRKLEKEYAHQAPILLDGIRLDFGNSWVLARQSNTESLIRVYAESAEGPEKAQALADRIVSELV